MQRKPLTTAATATALAFLLLAGCTTGTKASKLEF
jgi:hypothetical protein